MRKLFLLLLLMTSAAGAVCAQVDQGQAASEGILIDRPHAQDWISDINEGWRVHEGDNPAYANPSFDDSTWQSVDLESLGTAQPGWRWFRLHIRLHENHPELALLIEGGAGTYGLFLNGAPSPGARLSSSFAVNRPIERVFPLNPDGTEVVVALRTHIPTGYAAWRFPQFMSVSLGTPDAVDTQRRSLFHDRTYSAIPAIVINALIAVAGFALLALYARQREHLEYFWLAFYFFLVGLADVLWYLQQSGFIALAWNVLVADPLIYAIIIAQTRFTFAFGGRRLGTVWRVYQYSLLVPVAISWFVWYGRIASRTYMIIEPLFILPVAILLPILLFVWYRKGNREAGWLVLPSLLPPATLALYDLGSASIYFGWRRFDFLVNNISIGPVSLEPNDLCNLLFFLSTLIIIFFRFSRVARDQARSAAELAAAREIQRRLVPEVLPQIRGARVEAAYRPAQEVGGDFYQVVDLPDGAALVVVGDVSGKGLKAAMTGTLAIGALRTLAGASLGPAEILSRMNRQIVDARCEGFITCLCMRLAADGRAILANAGHLAPYRNGEEIPLEASLPLGLSIDERYGETAIQIEAGDTLTLVSDGVVEARDSRGQLFGFDRTRTISAQSAERIADAAQAFGQEDDITVLTLAWTGIPVPA